MTRYNQYNFKNSLKSIDPKICDHDNKSDSKSNRERVVCDPQPCGKFVL